MTLRRNQISTANTRRSQLRNLGRNVRYAEPAPSIVPIQTGQTVRWSNHTGTVLRVLENALAEIAETGKRRIWRLPISELSPVFGGVQ